MLLPIVIGYYIVAIADDISKIVEKLFADLPF